MALLALLTGLLVLAGTTMPIHSEHGVAAHSMFSDNRTNDMMVLAVIALPLLGACVARRWAGAGFAAGACLVSAAWAWCAVASTVWEITNPENSTDPGALPGLFVLAAGAAAGVVTFGAAMIAAVRLDHSPLIPGVQHVLGVGASVAVTVGLMWPPPGLDETFLERNLRIGHPLVDAAWLCFVTAFGVAGVVGFAMRRPFGLGVVAATVPPIAWMVLVHRLGLDSATEPGPTVVQTFQLSALVAVAVAAQVVALGVALARATAHPRGAGGRWT